MAGVRDPAFWKRFSVAVHLDEEDGSLRQADIKNRDAWLARQNRKKSRHFFCWFFWLLLLVVIGAVIGVIVWLAKTGVFDPDDKS